MQELAPSRLVPLTLWAALVIVVTIMLINALYMLISPKAWFSLPRWLGLHGVLIFERYGNRWRELQIRILGVIIMGAVAWVVIELIRSR